ncbi:MAG TPA: heme-binding protein [Xanthobacteraceae bacterium]|nr:heme-binding protein [Xanthobacteraceae bacterium]
MLTLQKANAIIEAILKKGREMKLRPLCVVVTDIGAKIKAAQREDGCSQARIEMALGKAVASLALGRSSAFVRERQKQGPEFIAQVQQLIGEKMFAVGGGELIRDDAGNILGAVGVTGATEAEDEELVAHGIRAAGFKTDQDLAHLGPLVRARP